MFKNDRGATSAHTSRLARLATGLVTSGYTTMGELPFFWLLVVTSRVLALTQAHSQ